MTMFDRKEWYASRGISYRDAERIAGQLSSQYLFIGKALNGEPVAGGLLETELVQLVLDVQRGRFPISQASQRKSLES